MSRLTRSPRRDANEADIKAALEAQGFVVMRHSGTGEPDLIVFQRKTRRAWLVEFKGPGKPFTPAQNTWRAKWQGPAPITLRTVDDALRFMLLACEAGGDPALAAPRQE